MSTNRDLPYETRVLTDCERRNYGNATDLRPARVTTNTGTGGGNVPAPAPPAQQETTQKK